MDDFASKYAYGFSIALDPVLCRAGVNESSAVGFGMVSDALLFYSMVQGHFRQLRFWAWYGSASRHASFEFREGDTSSAAASGSAVRANTCKLLHGECTFKCIGLAVGIREGHVRLSRAQVRNGTK
jgi:hypothetical protein